MYVLLAIIIAMFGMAAFSIYKTRYKKEPVINPSEYFDYVKSRKQKMSDADLDRIYDNCIELLNKYKLTGQTQAMRKLIFHLDTIEKEREIIKHGITTFVYEDEVRHYIKDIASDVVKIIELENYPREVPDNITQRVADTKELFDVFYVVFTDYTGEVESAVQKERRDKDPILFGVFKDDSVSSIIDRFYFIGDWEDEYCDLTLDKMVSEIRQKEGRSIEHTIKDATDIEALKKELGLLRES